MAKAFEMVITGVKPEEIEQALANLEPRLMRNLHLGFKRYVTKHLKARMKERLSRATQPTGKSHMGTDGIPRGGGGYGVPENSPNYAAWKQSRANLPMTGNLSPRALVATGHLVDSIRAREIEKAFNKFSFEIGVEPGPRPKAKAMSSDPKGSNNADVSQIVENTELAQWIEDSKYAFWVTEYEDVQRDVVPLVLHLLKITIKQLWAEFVKGRG